MNWKKLLCEKRRRSYTTSAVSSDQRNEFQKDYHRIIGSASFRRLQDKTQVFPLDRGDFVRTRLTHSLEVSSFAKSLLTTAGMMIFPRLISGRYAVSLNVRDLSMISAIRPSDTSARITSATGSGEIFLSWSWAARALTVY